MDQNIDHLVECLQRSTNNKNNLKSQQEKRNNEESDINPTNQPPPTTQLSTAMANTKPSVKPKVQNSGNQTSTTPIFGKGEVNNNVTGHTKPFSLFFGGFNTNLDDNDIKSYVEDEIGIKVVGIESNRRNTFNQSYRIDIP